MGAAGEFGFEKSEAKTLIEPMVARVFRWHEDFENAGVGHKDLALLENAFGGSTRWP